MRKEILNLQEGSEGSRDVLLKYFVYLRFISAHFPINNGSNKINLDFSWYDSFTRKRVSQGNIYYEQANVLFNAAIITAQLANAELRNTADSAKTASLHFQVSAGIFSFIKETLIPLIPEKVTVDLTGDAMESLSQLMMAQAQQAVYEFSLAKKMKNSNLAKLAYDCSDLYENTYKAMVNTNCSEDFDKYTLGYVQSKQLYYEATANYHLAIDLHENISIGPEISRLKKAKELLDKTKQFYLTNGLKSNYASFNDVLDKALKTAESENQKIYHERVPGFDTLPILEKYRLAKMTTLKDYEKEFNISDPFSLLVPVNILEAKGRYAEQLSQKVVPAFRNARSNRERIIQELSKMGLPGSVVAAEKKSGYPEQVHQKVGNIQQVGGVNRLLELKKTLDELSEETKKGCFEILSILDKEEKEDKDCREQYNIKWNRLPSYQLNSQLRKQADDFKNKVELAQKSDQLINQKISQSQQLFKIFQMNRLQLDSTMPKNDHEDNVDAVKSFNELKTLLAELDSLFEKENEIDRGVKNLMETEQVEKEFLHKQQNLDKAIVEQIGVYETKYLNPLMELQDKELKVFQQIVTANNVLMKIKGNSQISSREKAVQDAYTAINKYDEITANIQEGIRFYSTMQDLIRKERNKVEDFVFARRTEKQDLISNIQIQITGFPQQQSFVYQQPQQQYNQQYQQFQQYQNQQTQQNQYQQQPHYQYQNQQYPYKK